MLSSPLPASPLLSSPQLHRPPSPRRPVLADAQPSLTAAKSFVTGAGAASIATCAIQPMDMVKTRLQLSVSVGMRTSPFVIASTMAAEEGVAAFYTGLSASLMRQVVYGGARLGLYDRLIDVAHEHNEGRPLQVHQTAACALSAGAMAAIIGNPCDVSLVRMQADSMLPAAERRGYSSVASALKSIIATEGAQGLLKGAGPTASRAMGLNLGMLAGNTEAKKHLKRSGVEGDAAVFGASAIAGFFAAAFSLPFDYVKTCIQNQKPDARGVLPYKNALDCVMQTLREGGPLRFYSGFATFYCRVAPHAMITLIAADKLKNLCKQWGI